MKPLPKEQWQYTRAYCKKGAEMDGAEEGRRIAKGFGLIALTNIISVLIGFSTSAIIARSLGVAAFGEFSLALAIFATALTICVFGLNFAAIRYVSKFEGDNKGADARGVIRSALVLGVALSILFAVITFLFSGRLAVLFQKNIGSPLRIFALGIVFAGAMAILLAVFQGLQKFGSFSKLTIFHNSAKLILVAALLFLGAGTIGATIGIVGAYVATCMLGFYFIRKYARFRHKTNFFPYLKLLSYGFSLSVYTWLFFGINRISIYLLGIFSPSSELGLYSGALMLTQGFFIIPDSLNSVLFPALSRMYGRRGMPLQRIMHYSWKFGALITFPVLVYIGIFAPQIVYLVFSSGYTNSASVLRIMLAVGFSYFFYSTAVSVLLAADNRRFLVQSALLAVIGGIISGFFLVPNYGSAGAALTDGISYLLLSASAVFVLKRNNFNVPYRIIFKAALSSLLLGVFLWYSVPYLKTLFDGFVFSLIGLILYSGSLLLSKTIDVSDLRILSKIFIKR